MWLSRKPEGVKIIPQISMGISGRLLLATLSSLVVAAGFCGQVPDEVQPAGKETPPMALSPSASDFAGPQRVEIRGYEGDSMEPFISRDDRFLFFNDSNAPGEDTNLHYAQRIGELSFEYRGQVEGANSSELDAVASMDQAGRFFFVSTRNYLQTLNSIFSGRFAGGSVSEIVAVSGVSMDQLGYINFDAEISLDGERLYFVDGLFRGGAVPERADMAIAVRTGNGFERHPESDVILGQANTRALEYAPSISADELELFFTRLEPGGSMSPSIFRSVRGDPDDVFRTGELVSAAQGFVEGPSLSLDGSVLYYHKLEDGVFVIYKVTRKGP